MKKTMLLFILLAVGISSSYRDVFGFGNQISPKGGHDTITSAAGLLKTDVHKDDREFANFLTGGSDNVSALKYFLTGAHDEDSTIPFDIPLLFTTIKKDPLHGPNHSTGGWLFHFYNPGTGLGWGGLLPVPNPRATPITPPSVVGTLRPLGSMTSAPGKAGYYYERFVKDQFCPKGKFQKLPPTEKQKVYDYLGRIMHLIQDMSSPPHVKGAFTRAQGIHGLFGPGGLLNPIFENYVAKHWDTITSSETFRKKVNTNYYSTGGYGMSDLDPFPAMDKSAKNTFNDKYPDDSQLYDLVYDPYINSERAVLNQERLTETANELVPEAILRTAGFIDTIYKAVEEGGDDCVNQPPTGGPGADHPDDNFDVSKLTENTQFRMSAYEQLDFYAKLALKKGNMAPVYMKQIMEIYAEGKALLADATQEQKDILEQRFATVVNKLNAQPMQDIDTSPDVAILENGYYMQMTAIANKHKEPVKIALVDFSPEIVKDHPVLVIPSAGLYGMERSAVFKASLDEYVKQGGTLVVFSQQYGYEFAALPVPQETDGTYRTVKGYGWVEDQSCFANSVYTDTYHQMLSGQSRATPSFNVDGYFTDYPSNATLILKRTVNGQPAMIMYEYGLGRVIVTSMYSDFAYGSSQASSEEIAFIRDIISWAKKPAQLAEKKPGENTIIPVSINNVADTAASQIKFQLYSPDRSQLISEQTVNTGLAAHASTDITLQYTAPATLGIYHIDYILLDAQGVAIQPQTETDSGRFVVSNPLANPYKSSDFNFSATTATDRVQYGSDALFTVHIWNNTSQTRTVTAKYVFPHMYLITHDSTYGVYSVSYQPGTDGQWLTKTVSVGANGIVNFDHVVRNTIHDEFIYVNFYDEDNKYLGSATAGFYLFYPSLDITVMTDKSIYTKGETVTSTINIQNKQNSVYGTTIKVRIADPANTSVYDTTFDITLPGLGTTSRSLSFTLPAQAQGGSYATLVEAYGPGGNKIGMNLMRFELPLSRIRVTPELPAVFTTGQNTVVFELANTGAANIYSGILDITVKDPEGIVVYSNSQMYSLLAGETKRFNTLISLPSLKFGDYTLAYSQSDETKTGYPVAITIPNAVNISLTFDKSSCSARDLANLNVSLSSRGKFKLESVGLTVSIPDANFTETRTISVDCGQTSIQQYVVPIPETISVGEHGVNVLLSVPSGNSQTMNGSFIIRESSLAVSLDQAEYNAGETAVLSLRNNGGVDTVGDLVLRLYDDKDSLVFETLKSEPVQAGTTKNIEISLSAGITSGQYQLIITCKNQRTAQEITMHKTLTIRGVQTTITSVTDKQSYLLTDSIAALTSINNTGDAIGNNTLSLIVMPASAILRQEQWDSTWNGNKFHVDTSSSPGDVLLDKHNNPITNGGFETGNLTGWTSSGINNGAAYVTREGTWFSSHPTDGILMEGDFCINVRSAGGDPTNSWGILTSDLFILVNSTINWLQLSESQNVYFEYRVLDASNTVLKTASMPIATSNWGIQTIDVSEYIGQAIQIEFRQHTMQSGLGWFTLLDNISNGSVYNTEGAIESETKDYGVLVDFKNIQWTATVPSSTSIKFQIATNNDNDTWQYVGPDGTSNTYYTSGGADINAIHNGKRYMRWKAYLATSDITISPILHSLTIKAAENSEQILWQKDIPVSLETSAKQDITTPIGLLNVQGKLYLHTELKNSFGQSVFTSDYAFYIANGSALVTFYSDKKAYKPGELVTITGDVRNLTATTIQDLSLNIDLMSAAGSQTILSTVLSVPASSVYPFVVTTVADSQGVYNLSAKITQGTIVLSEISDKYQVISPIVTPFITIPDVVASEPFTVRIEIKNESALPAIVNLQSSIDTQGQSIPIPGGQTKIVEYSQQITNDTVYTFTFTGDVNQTITRVVEYGLAAEIDIGALPTYLEGSVTIPYAIINTGKIDETLSVVLTMMPGDIRVEKTYFIPKEGKASDLLPLSLTEGNYTMVLQTEVPLLRTERNFVVRKLNNVTISPLTIGQTVSGMIPVVSYITNMGEGNFEGAATLAIVDSQNSVVVWQTQTTLSIPAGNPPQPQPINLSVSSSVLPTGSYTVMVEVIGSNGTVISSQSIPYTVQGAKIVLSQIPAPVTVNPGEQTTFVFRVTNTGGKEGSAELSLKVYDLTNLARREWITPGETKEITISFLAPMDLEEKDYFADYELKDETATVAKGQVKYHLNGINISVNATLDKQNYRDGDTAHLTLTISPRTLLQSVNCFAKANYGGYEEKKDFSLSGAATLTFDVPLTKITGDKLAFGIYHESGRSIHLNSLYVYKTGEVFTVTTNKQVYNQGETGTMTITGSQPGAMTISGPGSYSDTFSFTGNATKTFVLPATATAGTYPIEAQLKLTTDEVISSTHPIDIAGIQMKVKEATLDKGKYAASDTMKLALKIESNTNMTGLLKVWITYPDNTSKYLSEKTINLTSAEPFIVSGEYPLTTQISGIHKLVYGIYSSDLLLVSGSEAFDVGDAVLLSIATDKPDYPLGTEPVSMKTNMYGTIAATLFIEIDGVNVKKESVSLNGFTKMDIPLGNVSPGAHALKATLTTGGLSSVKENSFTYGSSLADLVPDVWGSGSSIGKDTVMKLSVSVTNQGKTTSTPTTLTLSDGNMVLSTFSVPAIATGEIKSFEYLLQVMGRAGEHSFKVVVDPANSVIEFNRENNIVTRKITIPDIISFTDTPTDTYRMMEQIPVSTTIINLTQSIFYPNLTISTVVKDGANVEVFRKSSPFSAPPSRSSLFNDIWTPVNLAEGRYTITQTVIDGTSTLTQSTKTLTLLKGSGFVISVSKDNFILRQGETTSLTISVAPLTGWTGPVNLFAAGVPSGTNISFNTAASVIPPGNVTMSISTTEATPASTGTFRIVAEGFGNGASILQSIPITLTVQGFSITAAPQSVTIRQLETATFALTASSLNGYAGAITLSQQSGPIIGTGVSIDKPNMTIPDGTAVRIQTSKFTQPGNYTITIAAGDGVMVKKVNLPLVVVENVAIAPGLVLTPGPGYDNPALVTLVSRNFVHIMEFTAFSTKFGANAVMGDIDGDGEDEIIVAPGPDPKAEGKLRIYRKNGVLVLEKKMFNTHFGLNVAVDDIDGDLREEIIVGTGPDPLNAPRVKVLSWNGSSLVDTGIDFAPYPKATNCIFCDIFQLGVHLATADVDGDGKREIITGPGPGISNKARVKVFKLDTSTGMGRWKMLSVVSDFVVQDAHVLPFNFGINLAAGDTDGDGKPEIITGLGPNPLNAPTIKVYEANGAFNGVSFNAYSNIQGHSYQSGFGVYVAVRDLNGDGLAEIITGTGPSPFSSSWVKIFKGDGSLLNSGFLAYPERMHYGVKVSTGNVGE